MFRSYLKTYLQAHTVGKHIELTDKQTGTETKKRTFTDVINKGNLPRDMLSKGPVEQPVTQILHKGAETTEANILILTIISQAEDSKPNKHH